MSTLISIELSVSSIGSVVATAIVSDAPYPYYFSTSNIDRIKQSMQTRRVRVPEKIKITTTPEYERLTGRNYLKLVNQGDC